jgi:hypothetical protein
MEAAVSLVKPKRYSVGVAMAATEANVARCREANEKLCTAQISGQGVTKTLGKDKVVV